MSKEGRVVMNGDGEIKNDGVLLAENGVMYIVSFYPAQTGEETAETLINRAFQKEVMNE